MARLAPPQLNFDSGCPDCGERVAVLPLPIPGVRDDFDWNARDYDSFRLFMMQELASRFPERNRWTVADMEVVIVELLAAALDRASHAIDRVQAERFLDTARRPESLRRLLMLIGYDGRVRIDGATLKKRQAAEKRRFDGEMLRWEEERAAAEVAGEQVPPRPVMRSDGQLVEDYWRETPAAMEFARAEGPKRIAEQNRMVTLADHADMVEEHPLVALARARLVWTGAWQTILVSVLLEEDKMLDEPFHQGVAPDPVFPDQLRRELWEAIVSYHSIRRLPLPAIRPDLTGRRILRTVIDEYRMIGTEVFLEPAKSAAINVTLSVRANRGYFRSELKQALAQVFSADHGGFFEIGRLKFGQSLYASDVIEAAMAVEGVAVACLNLFRRVGKGFEDQSADGVITIADDEFIECRSDRRSPESGMLRIVVNGGEAG